MAPTENLGRNSDGEPHGRRGPLSAGRGIRQPRGHLLPVRRVERLADGRAQLLFGECGVGLPEPNLAVSAAVRQGGSDRVERHRVEPVRRAGQGAQSGGGARVGHVPEPEVVVGDGAGEHRALRVEGQRVDIARWSGDRRPVRDRLARIGDVEQVHGSVGADRERGPARVERDAVDVARESGQRVSEERGAGGVGDVPEPHGLVDAGGSEGVPVGAEGDVEDLCGEAGEHDPGRRERGGERGCVEESDSGVVGAGGQDGSGFVEGDRLDGVAGLGFTRLFAEVFSCAASADAAIPAAVVCRK